MRYIIDWGIMPNNLTRIVSHLTGLCYLWQRWLHTTAQSVFEDPNPSTYQVYLLEPPDHFDVSYTQDTAGYAEHL